MTNAIRLDVMRKVHEILSSAEKEIRLLTGIDLNLTWGDGELRLLTYKDVVDVVSKTLNVPVAEIMGASRMKVPMMARHVAYRLMKEEVEYSNYSSIGRFFGRDHATVINSLTQTDTWLKTDTMDEFIGKYRLCKDALAKNRK